MSLRDVRTNILKKVRSIADTSYAASGARYNRLVSQPMGIRMSQRTREVGMETPFGKSIPSWAHWQGRVSVKNTMYAFLTGADANRRTTALATGIGRTALVGGVATVGSSLIGRNIVSGMEDLSFGQRIPEGRGVMGIRGTQTGMARPLATSIDMLNYRRRKMSRSQQGRPRWV